ERYNANLQRLERVWSRATVELRWREDGKRRLEQGEGHLILALPDRLAMSIGKLGGVSLWAGADKDHYWLFNLLDANDKHVHVGMHALARVGDQRGPLPFRPIDLPRLLGLVTLDPNVAPKPKVHRLDGNW